MPTKATGRQRGDGRWPEGYSRGRKNPRPTMNGTHVSCETTAIQIAPGTLPGWEFSP
jgi:hypothetical protein